MFQSFFCFILHFQNLLFSLIFILCFIAFLLLARITSIAWQFDFFINSAATSTVFLHVIWIAESWFSNGLNGGLIAINGAFPWYLVEYGVLPWYMWRFICDLFRVFTKCLQPFEKLFCIHWIFILSRVLRYNWLKAIFTTLPLQLQFLCHLTPYNLYIFRI